MTGMEFTPVYDLNAQQQNNDGFGAGGNWIWIILLFFILTGGNGSGFGNRNGGVDANPATNLINNDFLYTQSKIDNLGQAIISQTNAINQTLNAGFSGVNSGLCDIRHQMDMGFCGVNRSIDQVRFENAQSTCAITTAISDSTRSIVDLINANTMQDLRDRNVELAGALSNSQQTQAIEQRIDAAVNQIRPYPQAAYLTNNPQCSPFPFYGPAPFYGQGFGGCGSGCHPEPRWC